MTKVAEATQDLLHNIGFDTCWAGDGPAALALVENDPELALVMSDIVMPGGVSGLDLARRLRDRRQTCQSSLSLPATLATRPRWWPKASRLIEKPYRRGTLAGVAPIGARKARPVHFRDTYRLLTIQKRLSVEVRDLRRGGRAPDARHILGSLEHAGIEPTGPTKALRLGLLQPPTMIIVGATTGSTEDRFLSFTARSSGPSLSACLGRIDPFARPMIGRPLCALRGHRGSRL